MYLLVIVVLVLIFLSSVLSVPSTPLVCHSRFPLITPTLNYSMSSLVSISNSNKSLLSVYCVHTLFLGLFFFLLVIMRVDDARSGVYRIGKFTLFFTTFFGHNKEWYLRLGNHGTRIGPEIKVGQRWSESVSEV